MKEKKFKLPREFAEKWLKSLRSGKFRQGAEFLELRSDEIGDSHCCLGVACRIVYPSTDLFLEHSYISPGYFSFEEIDILINSGFPEELLGEEQLPLILSELNDGNTLTESVESTLKTYKFREEILKRSKGTLQLSFSEIADWIEDNVEFYDT